MKRLTVILLLLFASPAFAGEIDKTLAKHVHAWVSMLEKHVRPKTVRMGNKHMDAWTIPQICQPMKKMCETEIKNCVPEEEGCEWKTCWGYETCVSSVYYKVMGPEGVESRTVLASYTETHYKDIGTVKHEFNIELKISGYTVESKTSISNSNGEERVISPGKYADFDPVSLFRILLYRPKEDGWMFKRNS